MLSKISFVRLILYYTVLKLEIYFMDDIKEGLSNFLTNKPLYSRHEIPHYLYIGRLSFMENQTFIHFCPDCKNDRTFKLYRQANELKRSEGECTSHCFAICQYCGIYKMEITLNAFPDPKNTNNMDTAKFYIRKIGQNPPYQIRPKKEVNDYLSSEDKENYSKALMCFSQNYGIGAFSYFRRIVENELRKIVKDVSGLEMPELDNVRTSHIIEESFNLLPSSLKGLGVNPIKVLWEQLSGGIHEMSEDECMEKAESINHLLSFVIEKINENNTEIKSIKNTLKKLIKTA